jgi:hypothetical protein
MTEECSKCRFYAELAMPAGKQRNGLCRRRAPSVVLLGHVQSPIQGRPPQPIIQGFFPEMGPAGWCGDFEAPRGLVDVANIDLSKLDIGDSVQ